MCNRLSEVLASARAAVSSLELDTLNGTEAATLFETGA
jgi:hypothetical protein